jgi:hypothetical protein
MSGQADPNVFFSQKNEKQLENFVTQQFPDIQTKQRERIKKTIQHYMNEVYEVSPNFSIQALNREVVRITMIDYTKYLDKEKREFERTLTEDTSQRYERLQNERKDNNKTIPEPPDFRMSITEDGPPAAEIFERMKMDRQNELDAPTLFASQDDAKNQFISNTLKSRNDYETENKKAPIFAKLFQNPVTATTATTAIPDGNPTLTLPTQEQMLPSRQQDFIIKQDDVVRYKENEYNLFIYSADRNWTKDNGTENRYNFTVNFDPAGNQSGFNMNPAAQIKFKNISRIEIVKAIIPTEGLDPLYKSTIDTNINTLSFPYVILRVPELETNNYGTDNYLDRSFGVLQYDAMWNSDYNSTRKSSGYLAMIPKFMKCQKVYHPTPLATLQRLTIQVQRPDGTQLSQAQDTYNISNIYGSGNVSGSEVYKGENNGYIWIQTSNWFNPYMIAESERVVFSNVSFPLYSNAYTADLTSFIQKPDGHLVVGTGITGNGTGLYGSTNTLGYMNTLIISSRYNDPTTGATSLNYFGGSESNTSEMFDKIASIGTSGKMLNLNHQTQYVFRVITRDYDSSSRIRPDNL